MRNYFNLIKIFILFFALLGCAAHDPELETIRAQPVQPTDPGDDDDGYDVFLLIGQSNMAGRGYMASGDDTYNMENVWLLNDSDQPEAAKNPINKYSSVRKGLSSQRISPGTKFGVAVAEKTGKKILLVSNALGGSNITKWMKDSPLVDDKDSRGYNKVQLYSEAVRRAKEAMKHGKLKGILWHQGEANRSKPGEYMGHLTKLVSDLRADLGEPDVPVIVGELAYWIDSQVTFNEMLRTVGTHIPNSDYVSAVGLGQLIDASDPHFNREGQLKLGERYADKVLEMVYGIAPTHTLLTVPPFKRNYSWVQTDFVAGKTYVIEYTETIRSAEIRPYSKNVSFTTSGNSLIFTLPAAGQYVVYINGFKVCVFAEKPEQVPTGAQVANIVTEYGCTNDGKTDQTQQIQSAINSIAGSGKTLFFPKGKYLAGRLTIKEKDGVKIYLERGAEIVFDTTRTGLLSTAVNDLYGDPKASSIPGKNRWTETRGFIVIDNSKNVEIAGYGTINGRGRAGRRNGIVEGVGARYRNFLITRSENILIDGIVSADPGSWNTHVILCKDVTCRNMKLLNELDYAPEAGNLDKIDHNNVNTDGFDPDATTNMLIQDCFAYCADDNVAVKTSEYCGLLGDLDGLTVERCVFLTQKSSLKVGTETGGEYMKNITFRDNDVIESDRGIVVYCYDGAQMTNIKYINNRIEKNFSDRIKAAIAIEFKPRQTTAPKSKVGKAEIRLENTTIREAFPSKSQIRFYSEGASNESTASGSTDLKVTIKDLYVAGTKITERSHFSTAGSASVTFE